MANYVGDVSVELTYTPKPCLAEGAKVTGTVTIRPPSVIEKYKYIEKFGIKLEKDGKVDMEKLDGIGVMVQMMELSEKHYKKVELKKADGTAIDSWEKLTHDPDCEKIVIDVATCLVRGFQPSGN